MQRRWSAPMAPPCGRWLSRTNRTLADVLVRMLTFDGWSASQAGTVRAAIAAAQEFKPDVVVLDVMLPDGSGLEVLRVLRELNPRCMRLVPHREGLSGGPDHRHHRRR